MHWYEAHATRDTNDTWLLTVPALPELASYGASQIKAFANLRKGVQVAIAGRIEANQHIPSPKKGPANGVKAIELPVLTVIKLALYSSMKAQNISVPALAARLTTSEDRIQRLLRIEHNSQLDLLDQALQALGGSMHLGIDAPGFDCPFS